MDSEHYIASKNIEIALEQLNQASEAFFAAWAALEKAKNAQTKTRAFIIIEAADNGTSLGKNEAEREARIVSLMGTALDTVETYESNYQRAKLLLEVARANFDASLVLARVLGPNVPETSTLYPTSPDGLTVGDKSAKPDDDVPF